MKNIVLKISYVGTLFYGWQKTTTGPSIEASLEKALITVLQHPVKLQAASRTDRGVHARGQVVNFQTHKTLDLKKLHYSLNQILPKDISILEMHEAPLGFHPTLDCRKKEYIYSISNSKTQLPFDKNYAWHFPTLIDVSIIKQASPVLIGTHDFSAFTNEVRENNIRTITSIEVYSNEKQMVTIHVEGNNFLYKMVRTIVGTLAYIGARKISPENLPIILKSKDRKMAGVCAPAHGLLLNKVFYDLAQ